jgi:hypothetical protein
MVRRSTTCSGAFSPTLFLLRTFYVARYDAVSLYSRQQQIRFSSTKFHFRTVVDNTNMVFRFP